MEDITYVEVLEPDSGRPATGIGEVVGTELHNRTQPFIRYRQGDLARIGAGGCPCGRPGRLVLQLEGRANDGFATLDGGRLSPGFLLDACYRTLMASPDLVAAYRLVQLTLATAELQVVPGPGWGEGAPDVLAAGLERELDRRLHVRVAAVPSLERGPAGKRATIVSGVGAAGQADPADQNHA
jgi:phenylacetate-CoA ligase